MFTVFTKNHKYSIYPTVFPDNTSQIWKTGIEKTDRYLIHWEFSGESEVFQLAQLVYLLRSINFSAVINLHCSFLPYGRQDKRISDTTTFALQVFEDVLKNLNLSRITAIDTHSNSTLVESIYPIKDWESIIRANKYDLIIFPDKGAQSKYSSILDTIVPTTFFNKIRDPLTGDITGISPENADFLKKSSSILVIDDICDGGRTFIELIKQIPNKTVDLFVSHGIFSKGTDILYQAGYRTVYTPTRDSYLSDVFIDLMEEK
jgi:ribose-phosphate pyrophosphokinase